MEPFYRRRGARFAATVSTRGPWDERSQHGGPPAALLLRAMAEHVRRDAGDAFSPVRLTAEFLRPVPIAELRVEVVESGGGRSVRRVRACLETDRRVMEASALFIRRDTQLAVEPVLRPGAASDPWPAPDTVQPFRFPFFPWEEGYHRAVDVRVLDAPWGSTPVRCWARPTVPLIDDDPPTPEEAVVVLADAESGMGPPLDPTKFSYLNPDLTVYFTRRPRTGWLGLSVRSHVGDAGAGLSESELRDADGVFGQSAQSLVLGKR